MFEQNGSMGVRDRTNSEIPRGALEPVRRLLGQRRIRPIDTSGSRGGRAGCRDVVNHVILNRTESLLAGYIDRLRHASDQELVVDRPSGG